MDVLSEVLQILGAQVCQADPGSDAVGFQLCWVMAGRAWLRWPEQVGPRPFFMDEVMVASLAQPYWVDSVSEPGVELQLFRIRFEMQSTLPHPLLDLLRGLPLRVQGCFLTKQALRNLHWEQEKRQPGFEMAVEANAKLLLVAILRTQVERETWFSALTEPGLSEALRGIHQHPERAWTQESLAREAGLSRGGFSDKFQAWVGMGAMAYLRLWRIHRGLQMLRQGQGSQEEIGLRCGYQSRAAFSRAVQSVTGASFRELRRGQA